MDVKPLTQKDFISSFNFFYVSKLKVERNNDIIPAQHKFVG